MTYPVDLWACRKRNETRQTDGRYETTCAGFRYVEAGEDPGPCGHVVMVSEFETTCPAPMDLIAKNMEMEEEHVEART